VILIKGKVIKIRKFLYLMFGEWNGFQNFLAPAVLIFMFDYQSFFQWLVNMLTSQIYYLPVAMYFIVLVFLGLIMLKAVAQWTSYANPADVKVRKKLGRDLLIPLFIRFHQWLFAVLTLMMIVYVLRNGFAYFYKTHVSMYKIYFWIVRLSFVYVAFYVYVLLDVVVPMIKKGHSFKSSERYLLCLIFCRPVKALLKYFLQFIIILATIQLFRFGIRIIENSNDLGLLFMSELPIRVIFREAHSIGQVLVNLLIVVSGFLLSNLLYSPLMYLLKLGFEHSKLSTRPR